jgi:hypothetical protein
MRHWHVFEIQPREPATENLALTSNYGIPHCSRRDPAKRFTRYLGMPRIGMLVPIDVSSAMVVTRAQIVPRRDCVCVQTIYSFIESSAAFIVLVIQD